MTKLRTGSSGIHNKRNLHRLRCLHVFQLCVTIEDMSGTDKNVFNTLVLAGFAVIAAVVVINVMPDFRPKTSTRIQDISKISTIDDEDSSSDEDENGGDKDDDDFLHVEIQPLVDVVEHKTFNELQEVAAHSPSPSEPAPLTSSEPARPLSVFEDDVYSDVELQDLEFEVVEENECPETIHDPPRPSDAGKIPGSMLSAREIVGSVQTVWPSFLSSMVLAFKCVYEPVHAIRTGAVEKYLNTQGALWSDVPSDTYYKTGGRIVAQRKKYLLAFSDSMFSYPTIMITFPGIQLSVADLRTVLSFLASTSNGIDLEVHGGFDAAAASCFPEIVSHIDAILKKRHLNIANVQILCCGHSLGGAIATLCAYRLLNHYFAGSNAQNNVLIFSMGQPKTIKASSVNQFTRVVLEKNYVRFVTYGTYGSRAESSANDIYSKGSTAKDPITGFRRVHKNARDSIGMMHGGTEVMINSGVWLKNEPFVSSAMRQVALRGGVNVVLVTASVLFTGKERFSLHGQVVYFAALENYTREMRASLAYTHHTGRYCNSKFFLWQEKWWNCCGKPNFDAPFCQPGDVRKHTGDWHTNLNYWDCCKNKNRSGAGCNGNNHQHHHPGRYSTKHHVYFCCMGRLNAVGCQQGAPRHHTQQWATHRKKWKCCNSRTKSSKGCTSGL